MIGLLSLSVPLGAVGAVLTKRQAKRTRPVPVPSISAKPARRTTQTSARFTFSDRERGVTFVCSLDGATPKACPATQRYGPSVALTRCRKRADHERGGSKGIRAKRCRRTRELTEGPLTLGEHTIRVRARDRRGRLSRAASYTWTIESPAAAATPVPSSPSPPPSSTEPASGPPSPPGGRSFSLSTAGSGSELFPGGPPETIPLTLYNPSDEALYVTSVTVAVSRSPAGCEAASNLRLTQSNVSAERPVIVPAKGSVTLPAQGASAPTVQLLELPSNQDACKGASFRLRYTGDGHS
jgi:hypothetical protein